MNGLARNKISNWATACLTVGLSIGLAASGGGGVGLTATAHGACGSLIATAELVLPTMTVTLPPVTEALRITDVGDVNPGG